MHEYLVGDNWQIVQGRGLVLSNNKDDDNDGRVTQKATPFDTMQPINHRAYVP